MNRFAWRVLLSMALFSTMLFGQNQTPNAQPSPGGAPQAKSGDVDSVEHIVAALYDVISGPAGKRDWDRFRSLFYPGAHLIPTRREQDGKISATLFTPDEYVQRAQTRFEKEGFFENSVANRVELWDHIAHVWSTYESRRAKGEKPFARGINSIQVFHDGSRWWILNVYWQAEDQTHSLPDKYLK